MALASCAQLPDGDQDAAGLIAALAARGVPAETPDWRGPDVDWEAYQLVVVRSTWDYTRHHAEFLAWADARGPALRNPAAVVRWNGDKTYLRDLSAAGLPVVPTVWARPGRPVQWPDGEVVVKPSVGAGSRGAGRFAPTARAQAQAHLAALHAAGRTAMVQPYLHGVDAEGETALVYLDGRFSHAVRKNALLPPDTTHDLAAPPGRPALWVEETMSARTATAAQRAVGDAVLAGLADRFGGQLLYARVDLLPGADGPLIVEVELVEPSLFLEFGPGAVDRLADAVVAQLAA